MVLVRILLQPVVDQMKRVMEAREKDVLDRKILMSLMGPNSPRHTRGTVGAQPMLSRSRSRVVLIIFLPICWSKNSKATSSTHQGPFVGITVDVGVGPRGTCEDGTPSMIVGPMCFCPGQCELHSIFYLLHNHTDLHF